MGTNQYLLEWNQHLENFAESFCSLRDQSEYVDCSLACEDGIVGAHRIILAGCSSYFQQLFSRTANPHPIIFLTNTRRSLVLLLMEFIYRGKTYVPQEKLSSLLELGRQLRVKGLVRVNTPFDSMTTVSTSDEPVAATECMNSTEEDQSENDDVTMPEGNGCFPITQETEPLEEPSINGLDEDLNIVPSSSEPVLARRRGRPKNHKSLPRTKGRNSLLKFHQKDGYTLSPHDILMLGGYAEKYGANAAIKYAQKRHKRNFRPSTIHRYECLFNVTEDKKKEKIESKLVHVLMEKEV